MVIASIKISTGSVPLEQQSEKGVNNKDDQDDKSKKRQETRSTKGEQDRSKIRTF